GEIDLRLRQPEGKARVAAEARGAPAASLSRIHVEKLAGNGDDLAIERGPEEAHPVVERRRQAAEISPNVKGAVGRAVGPDADAVQPRDHLLALLAACSADRPRVPPAAAGGEHPR